MNIAHILALETDMLCCFCGSICVLLVFYKTKMSIKDETQRSLYLLNMASICLLRTRISLRFTYIW